MALFLLSIFFLVHLVGFAGNFNSDKETLPSVSTSYVLSTTGSASATDQSFSVELAVVLIEAIALLQPVTTVQFVALDTSDFHFKEPDSRSLTSRGPPSV